MPIGSRQRGNLQRRCRRHQPKEKPLQEQMPRHQTRAASKNMMPKPSDKDNKQEKMMPAASDKGSQPYRNAFGCFEMAGARVAPIISACPWVGDMSSPCPLSTARFRVGIPLYPAIYFPSLREQWPLVRSPYGGSCMAGYHCLMPTAFSSVTTQHII